MNRTRLVIGGGILVVLALGAAQFLFPRVATSPAPFEPPPVEQVSTTTPSITTTVVNIPARTTPTSLSLASGDSVASWSFQGAYANNPELIAKAHTEIARLAALIGTGTYPDVTIDVEIANQYELLGDGKNQYEYLSRAISLGEVTGLPWHNLGVLMERLGALRTARTAYENASLIQPEIKFYHYSYLEFLIRRMKENAAAIEKEFKMAIENLGQDTDILELYAEWKKL